MSWIESLNQYLTAQQPLGSLWLFRTLFGTACLIKCWVEIQRGFLVAYQPTTWLYFRLRAIHPNRRERLPGKTVYIIAHGLRIGAAFGLTTGYLPRLCAAVLVLVFLAETRLYFRFHVNYFLLLSAALLFAPPMPTLVQTASRLPGGVGHTWEYLQLASGPRISLILIAITTTALYMGSARRKVSRVFLDGTVVWSQLSYTHSQQPLRHHFDGWYPRSLPNLLDKVRPGHPVWCTAMGLVVLLEATLPILLLWPETRATAITLGLLMHAGFVLLSPLTLLPFGIATTAAYLAFPVIRLAG
ncbi:hypothetical protein [Streptomyces lavendulae]|uniref:hypothetical protein n=1 Tax=Streptomyces lavendulae TaxID=1914 RepID=UPI0024A58543|nr:hypothetical protein [Streptomyces lavendulae]GLW04582.1 hypothetical protein Slala05_82120 [Streptomyces lavendulae subsp. lavendulae]